MRKLPTCESKYGAPMGRAEKHLPCGGEDLGGKFHLQQMDLDSGGYDQGGAYWGLRMPVDYTRPDGLKIRVMPRLYWYFLESSDGQRLLISAFVEAVTRGDAKAAISVRYPGCEFFR